MKIKEKQGLSSLYRHLERRPPVSGRACYPACHPERSEGSLRPGNEILRCAQDDRPSLRMSGAFIASVCFWKIKHLTLQCVHVILPSSSSMYCKQLYRVPTYE